MNMRKVQPGEIFRDDEQGHWLMLENSDANHLTDCAANLFTGEIKHVSRIPHPIKVVYGSEVMW